MTNKIVALRPGDPEWALQWRKKQDADEQRRIAGRACLDLMEQRAALRSDELTEKLSRADREKIASALAIEIEKLQTEPSLWKKPFSTAALMIEAGLATDPGNPTKRLGEYAKAIDYATVEQLHKRVDKLSASYLNFVKFIKALLAVSHEDDGEICARIFRGTSLEGTEVDVIEHRRIVRALNKSVKKINRLMCDFTDGESLEDIFGRTAEAKKLIQQNGFLTNWPFIDLWDSHDPSDSEVPNWKHPY